MPSEVMQVAEDLRLATEVVQRALRRVVGTADWSAIAAPTCWSCRDALDHVANALCGYATSLANRLTQPRLHHPRNGDPGATPADLLEVVAAFAGVLAAVVEAAPPEARAFHPAGMSDRDGFVAMGCDELLIHGHDIAAALSVECIPPVELAVRVRSRLFPWAPADTDPWSALLWANGRVALGEHERLGSDWWWHCAPLREWSGEPRRRPAVDRPG